MTPEGARRLYRRLPGWARAALPLRLEAWARARFRPGTPTAAAGLEDRLWGGFSRGRAARPRGPRPHRGAPREAAEAAWALARWHAAAGDFAAAARGRSCACAHSTRRAARDRRQFALEALFLCRLGRGAEARALLDGPRAAAGFDASLGAPARQQLAPGRRRRRTPRQPRRGRSPRSTPSSAASACSEIARRDPGRPLALDNLAARDPGPSRRRPAGSR